MRENTEFIDKSLDADIKPEVKAQLTIARAKCLPDEFHAWIKIAEFIYAKPKHVTVDGTLKLDELLGHWDRPIPITEAGGDHP